MTYQTFFEQPLDEAIDQEHALLNAARAVEALVRPLDAFNEPTLGVATESLTETLKAFFKAIITAIQKAWDAVSDFYDKILGSTARFETQIKTLQMNLQALKGAPKEPTMKLGKAWHNLSIYKGNQIDHCDNGTQCESTLVGLQKTLTTLLVGYSDRVIKVGDDLASAYNASKGKIIDAGMINKAAIKLMPTNHDTDYAFLNTKPELVDGVLTYEPLKSLPGGKAVYLRNDLGFGAQLQIQAMEMTDVEAKLPEYWTKLQNVRYSIREYDPKSTLVKDTYAVKTFTKDEMSKILKVSMEIIQLLREYRLGHAKSLKNTLRNLESSGNGFIDSKNSETGTAIYKSALRFVQAYGYWSTGVQKQLISVTHTTVQTALMATQHAMKSYGATT